MHKCKYKFHVRLKQIGVLSLTFSADDLGSFPGPVGSAADGRDVSLEEAVGALVPNHRVDVVVWASAAH